MSRRWRLGLALFALSSACAAPAAAPGDGGVVDVTILYTSDEHGWIAPRVADGAQHGGASQLLSLLVQNEDHCAGALPGAPLPSCEDSGTLLVSGGDNYTGPAISGLFLGESMAASLRRLGYRASAFGNHELDFGRDQYDENRAIASLPYLAANLERIDGKPSDMAQPYVVVRRRGASIGVIGIATVSTPETAAAHRFSAVRFADPTETLARVVPEVWETGVDAIVLLAHECHDVVGPMVRAHPEWKLSFVGTGHCHRTSVTVVDGVPVIGPDWRLEHYARVHLRIDRRAPSGERARLVHYELVDVASPSDAPPASIDPAFDAAIADWSQKVEEQLGEVIGYAKAGLARDSQALGAFIVESWRERFEADVALTTDGAIRQELPAGPIRVADIYSILPFENQLVVCTVPGSELAKILAHEEAIFTGVRRDAKGLVDANGGPIDPARRYRLVTTDFLFSGGDGFRLSELDDRPTSTKVNWREPVIAWTRAQKSSEARPLETVLSEAR